VIRVPDAGKGICYPFVMPLPDARFAGFGPGQIMTGVQIQA